MEYGVFLTFLKFSILTVVLYLGIGDLFRDVRDIIFKKSIKV